MKLSRRFKRALDISARLDRGINTASLVSAPLVKSAGFGGLKVHRSFDTRYPIRLTASRYYKDGVAAHIILHLPLPVKPAHLQREIERTVENLKTQVKEHAA